MEDSNEILSRVLQTLNTIEIKGKENISKMLGCMEAIQHVLLEEGQNADSDNSDSKNP